MDSKQNSERNRSSYLPGRCPGAVIPASGIYFVLGWTTHGAALWFVPQFGLPGTAAEPAEAERMDLYFSAQHTVELLHQAGFRECLTPEIVGAANECLGRQREKVLEAATEFFRYKAVMLPKGLTNLPTCWLADLPALLWKLKKPEWDHLPFFIDELKVADGLLLKRNCICSRYSGSSRHKVWMTFSCALVTISTALR